MTDTASANRQEQAKQAEISSIYLLSVNDSARACCQYVNINTASSFHIVGTFVLDEQCYTLSTLSFSTATILTTMCHNLYQIYACSHRKLVCITPCPHAHATGCQRTQESNLHISQPSQSASAPPTRPITPAAARRSDITDRSHQSQSQSAVYPSPLRVVASWPPIHQQSAFRIVATHPQPATLPSAYTPPRSSSSSTTPTPTSSREPSPTSSTVQPLSFHGRMVFVSSKRRENYR